MSIQSKKKTSTRPIANLSRSSTTNRSKARTSSSLRRTSCVSRKSSIIATNPAVVLIRMRWNAASKTNRGNVKSAWNFSARKRSKRSLKDAHLLHKCSKRQSRRRRSQSLLLEQLASRSVTWTSSLMIKNGTLKWRSRSNNYVCSSNFKMNNWYCRRQPEQLSIRSQERSLKRNRKRQMLHLSKRQSQNLSLLKNLKREPPLELLGLHWRGRSRKRLKEREVLLGTI